MAVAPMGHRGGVRRSRGAFLVAVVSGTRSGARLMRPSSAAQRQRDKQRREFKSRTQQWRSWKGLNIVDDRTAIDDDELFRIENAITLGKGKIRLLPAAGATIGPSAV